MCQIAASPYPNYRAVPSPIASINDRADSTPAFAAARHEAASVRCLDAQGFDPDPAWPYRLKAPIVIGRS